MIIPRADHLRLQRKLLEKGYLIVGEFDDDPAHFADLARTDYLALRRLSLPPDVNRSHGRGAAALQPPCDGLPQSGHSPPAAAPRGPFDNLPVRLFFGPSTARPIGANHALAQPRACGTRGSARVQVVYDRAFFDALNTPFKAFEPLCSYDRYKTILSDADIALLPLEPTRFNRHKSDLKFIECAAHGVAALASPTVYDRTIQPCRTGLIYQSTDDFAAMLDRLIRDGALRPHRRQRLSLRRRASIALATFPRRARLVSHDARPTRVARCRPPPPDARAVRNLRGSVHTVRPRQAGNRGVWPNQMGNFAEVSRNHRGTEAAFPGESCIQRREGRQVGSIGIAGTAYRSGRRRRRFVV